MLIAEFLETKVVSNMKSRNVWHFYLKQIHNVVVYDPPNPPFNLTFDFKITI